MEIHGDSISREIEGDLESHPQCSVLLNKENKDSKMLYITFVTFHCTIQTYTNIFI